MPRTDELAARKRQENLNDFLTAAQAVDCKSFQLRIEARIDVTPENTAENTPNTL